MMLCIPAGLESLQCALGTCSLKDRSWFLQRAKMVQLPVAAHLLCYTDGSYIPPVEDAPAGIGWACAFFRVEPQAVDAFTACLGVASGTMPDWWERNSNHLPIWRSVSRSLSELGFLQGTFRVRIWFSCF